MSDTVGRPINVVRQSDLATVATSGSYDDLSDKPTIPAVYYVHIALSPNQQNISAGIKKGQWPIKQDIRITSVSIDCDPANEPSAENIEVDANRIDRSTGVASSILSSVASIATSANTGTGTVNGTQDFDAGSMMTFDVDQGSDGMDLIVSVGYTLR